MTTRVHSTGLQPARERPGARVLLLCVFALVAGSLLFYVAALHVGGIDGTVGMVENIEAPRESWRIVPAANVDVLILWRVKEVKQRLPLPRCVRAVLLRTNANGEYSIGSWSMAPAWPPRFDADGDVYVSKAGYLPLVDRSGLAPHPPYTHILGPPAINPWTGLVLPDEDLLRPMHDRDCPPVERP